MPNARVARNILLTGATGYIGGRLLRYFEKTDHRIRCLARDPANVPVREGSEVEVVQADVLDPSSLAEAFEGIDTAYYLIHSMGAKANFEERDRKAAENFREAAARAGVKRLIYLGGLGDEAKSLSHHLRSRQEVGEILRSSGIETIEFRASVVIGSGSLSFEMVRSLTERLPVMVTPTWVSVPSQPIAVSDVIEYLAAAAELPDGPSRIFEIGGPDVISYAGLIQEYARQRGLKRWLIPVPLLTPRLSSLWLGLVTPLYARVGRKLIESIQNATVVKDHSALQVFAIQPMGVEQAISHAMRREDMEFAITRWSDALSAGGETKQWGGKRFGNRLVDSRTVRVTASPSESFRAIQRIGGDVGWYYADWLWRTRGFIDLLVGGVGLRRGRKHPEHLAVGDAVDFWRVKVIEPDQKLYLEAEMRVPGRAWLEFEVTPDGSGSVIRQSAMFDPLGLWGLLYWYGIFPLHQLVFAGMLRALARQAEAEAKRKPLP